MTKKFLIVGRSASGKTSIASSACDRLGLKMVKSYTTRPPRNEEEATDSRDHIFISEEDFVQYKDDIAAYAEINGNRYFTTNSTLSDDNAWNVYVINPDAILPLREKYKDKYQFIIVYVRTTQSIAKERAKKRSDDNVYDSRAESEDEEFTTFEKSMAWDYHLLNNDTFERAVETMCKFMKKEFNL